MVKRMYGLIFEHKGEIYTEDWSFPYLASHIGWSLTHVQWRNKKVTTLQQPDKQRLKDGQDCYHDTTDGTIACKACGVLATEFIRSARQHLIENTEMEK